MAEAFNLYVGDGVTVLYPFTFEYLETDDIYVSVDSQPNTNWVLSSATEITFNSAPANGADIIIFRRTDIDSMEAVFAAASAIRAKDLNLDFTQLRLAIEENRDLLSEAQINELMDLFWNKGSETLYLANTWESSDLKIASTAAINAYVTNAIDNVDVGVSSLTAGGNISLDPSNGLGAVTITSDPGVSRIVAGDNIVLNPSNGVGIVTINSTGGSGGIVYKGTRDLTQPAPNSPEDGDFYINTATSGTVNNTWTGIGGQALTGYERVVYDGSTWDLLPEQGGGGASVEVSETAPANPSEGDLWWDSSTDSGQLYIYYVDDDSSQWVEASSAAGGGGGGGDLQSVTDAGNTTTNGAFFGDDVRIGDDQVNDPKIQLRKDGTALFNQRVTVGTPSLNDHSMFIRNGSTIATICAYNTINDGPVYQASGADLQPKATINADGSATFAGDVKVGGTLPAAPNITLAANGTVIGKTFWTQSRYANGVGTYISDIGTVNIRNDIGGRAFDILNNGNTESDITVALYADGSASFAGAVSSKSYFTSDRDTAGKSIYAGNLNGVENLNIVADGSIYAGNISGSGTAGPGNIRIQLNAGDGSATFAGGVTSGPLTVTRGNGNNTNVLQTSGAGNIVIGASSQVVIDSSVGSATFAGPVSIGGTAAANTISEYEEGLWTPTLGGDSTFDIQWGKYVKVGSFVQCWGGLRPTNIGTGTARSILGLPFTAGNASPGTDQGGGSVVWGDGAANAFVSAVISVAINSTQAQINLLAAAEKVLQNNTDFWKVGNRANFYFCYFTGS